MKPSIKSLDFAWKSLLTISAVAFLYAAVVAKLVSDWCSDDNYSHGLIVPFVIAYIVWIDYDDLRRIAWHPEVRLGTAVVLCALVMVLGGTLAAELFTQRLSLVGMIAGLIIYFFGVRMLRQLVIPLTLLVLSIPIPQIIFNKITFPMQLFASRLAEWTIGFFNIASVRRGNVIEIVPLGQVQAVTLEVVEACSGVRSLMTLVTLALILGYVTSERRNKLTESRLQFLANVDFWRTVVLIMSAVPIALFTNSARVALTAIATYYLGPHAADGFWHESAGAIVFILGVCLLLGLNVLLKRVTTARKESVLTKSKSEKIWTEQSVTSGQTVALFVVLLTASAFINWFVYRGEIHPPRQSLVELPTVVGEWQSLGSDYRLDSKTEKVLGADDYIMRTYFSNYVWINFYVGYYGSQRSGSTYHSPLNCLPGSGWVIKDSRYITINSDSGRSIAANRYVVQNGSEPYLLVYWYQGRGRTTANEYTDKLFTSLDSLTQRRSDGSLVRFMTRIGTDENKSEAALLDFISKMSDRLSVSVPD